MSAESDRKHQKTPLKYSDANLCRNQTTNVRLSLSPLNLLMSMIELCNNLRGKGRGVLLGVVGLHAAPHVKLPVTTTDASLKKNQLAMPIRIISAMCCSLLLLHCALSATEHSQSPVAASETVCHTSLRQLRLLLFSESGSKLIFSLVRSHCN